MALPSGLPLNSDIGRLLSQYGTDLTGSTSIAAPFTIISNRAPMRDLANDLGVNMGINRVQMQDLYRISTESGPNGEPIFGLVGDLAGQVRFIGQWQSFTNINGSGVFGNSGIVGQDCIEITFYGDGLNILLYASGTNRDYRVTIDGGVEGANFYPTGASSILNNRNYAENQSYPVAVGLTPGLHTVRIRNYGATPIDLYGFEVINTSMNVRPGTSWRSGVSRYLATPQSLSYNSGFEAGTLGTKGGRVIVYQKPDGSIAKSVQPTDTTTAYLGSTNHINEEIARVYNFREFGAGRTDDFSYYVGNGSGQTKSFCLDDSHTALYAPNMTASAPVLGFFDNTGTITFTFVGTGLDVLQGGASAIPIMGSVIIDGVNVGTYSRSNNANATSYLKICSGLPYGTHTVRFTQTIGGSAFLSGFVVYQPKTPTIASDNAELARYNILANYSGSTSSVDNMTAQGVLYKAAGREWFYTGTWTYNQGGSPGGSAVGTSTNGSAAELAFFGSGVEVFMAATATPSVTIQIDGVNYTGAATPSNGGTWTPGTSTFVLPNNAAGTILKITGLTLGSHRVRVTGTSVAAGMFINGANIITPIHSHKHISGYVKQNSINVGSQGISDSRQFVTTYGSNNNKNVSYAIGVQSNQSTTSNTLVPTPDLSLTHVSKTGRVRISYSLCGYNTTGGSTIGTAVMINNVQVYSARFANIPTVNANTALVLSDISIINLQPGVAQKIDLSWLIGGGGVATTTSPASSILVEDIEW